MLVLKKVAVTGGLACGKSTVCRIFKNLGAHVVSADEVVHLLLSPETNLGKKVIELIGSDILIDHKIDRSKIAKKVFNQPKLLKELEGLLHPLVQEEIEKQYQQALSKHTATLFVAEIPLLFEVGTEHFFDFTIAVLADPEVCLQRFKTSTGNDDAEYRRRSEKQLSPEEKVRKADYVIYNNGSLELLQNAVNQLYDQLCVPRSK